MNNRGKNWTEEDIDVLKAMFRSVCTLPHIAENLGRSEWAVVGKLEQLGLLVRRKYNEYYKLESEPWVTQEYLKSTRDTED